MAFGKIHTTSSSENILRNVDEMSLLREHLGITELPCVVPSPLRKDTNASFGLSTPDGKRVRYHDFATDETGGIIDLLMGMYNLSFRDTLTMIARNSQEKKVSADDMVIRRNHDTDMTIRCRIRPWNNKDKAYWESYGITREWLDWAGVCPISHKFITKHGHTAVFGCPEHAYAFYEEKDGKRTVKVYQPYDKAYKWTNTHDRSVISLWTKVPQYGERIVIASSVKDALCISCQLRIPAIALQGEGYDMSDSAIRSLKERYKRVFIAFDSDKAGKENTKRLSDRTGFIPVYPDFGSKKDFSDYYLSLQDKSEFQKLSEHFI